MKSFRVDRGGITQVKLHRKSKSDSLKETTQDRKTSQSMFAFSQDKLKVMPETVVLAAEKLATKAIIFSSH